MSLARSSCFALLASLLAAASCSSGGDNAAGAGAASAGAGAGATGGGGNAGSGGGPISTVCTVAHQGTSGVSIKSNVLVPGAPFAGEVFIDATGKIACAAPDCSATAGYTDATVIACPGSVVSPGLINAHDHTNDDTSGPNPQTTTRWDHRNGWRTGAGGEPKITLPQKTSDPNVIAGAELRFVLGGATSILGAGTEGIAGLARNLGTYPDLTPLEGLTGQTVYYDTFPLGDTNGTELTSGCGYPSPTNPNTAHSGTKAYVPHISEGINSAARNEFTCAAGALNLLTANTAIIHGVGLNGTDVATMAQVGIKLIWSPRTNVSLYGNTAPVTEMKAAGITIALGTDWLFSGSMNMLRELDCAASLNKTAFGNAFTAEDLWAMATKNGAIVTRFDSQIGAIAPGLVGDVTVFAGPKLDYQAVLEAGVEDVQLVLRGGKVLYGDADLVTALAPSCEALDVCGKPKLVCVDSPGVTLASIQAATASLYPLFFCKDGPPTNEPSCVPYRDTYPNGPTAGDKDGDGIPDANDDCPNVFNPVRPMDGTTQADVDTDGAGDACDAKPTDPSAK